MTFAMKQCQKNDKKSISLGALVVNFSHIPDAKTHTHTFTQFITPIYIFPHFYSMHCTRDDTCSLEREYVARTDATR